MPLSKNLRVKDKTDLFYKNRSDFLVREFGISSIQVAKFLVATLITVIFVTFLVSTAYQYIAEFSYGALEHAWILYGCLTFVFVGIVLYIAAGQVRSHKNAMDATEFMNALFSCALSEGYRFCMIVAQDDSRIFYVDKEFQTMFPEALPLMNSTTLDTVLDKYGVAGAEREAVLQAVKRNVASEVKLHIVKDGGHQNNALVVLLAPIKRPAGFCLIRGRAE